VIATGIVSALLSVTVTLSAQLQEDRAMICEDLAFAWAEWVWTEDIDDPPQVQEWVYENCSKL
jgi:hypothetical protein